MKTRYALLGAIRHMLKYSYELLFTMSGARRFLVAGSGENLQSRRQTGALQRLTHWHFAVNGKNKRSEG